MEKYFVKVRSTKDIIIIATLIIAGVICVAVPMSDSMTVVGYILIAAGVIVSPFIKSGFKDDIDGKIYIKKEIYFPNKVRNELIAAVRSNPQTINLTERDKGNALRLEIFFSKESGKAFLQVYEYIPYTYKECTDIIECEIDKVKTIVA